MERSQIPNINSVASPPRRDLEYDNLDIGEVIGSGGQAVVSEAHVATENGTQRLAVKQPARDAKTLLRVTINQFLEEAQVWATVDAREREKPRWGDSEHVVGVIDFGDQLPWIAVEYMDGGNLNDRLAENPDGLPLEEALWVGECVCRGIEVAHSYGIAHLDLKPANILFRETSEELLDVPKVADWGVARVLADQTGAMEALSVEYASPEQLDSDQFGDPDMLTDIYQVGALMYSLLTGEPPFTGTQTAVLYDVVHGEPPEPPSTPRSEIPQELDAAVMIALERDKTNRYRSIGTFGEALRAVRTNGYLPPVVTSRGISSLGGRNLNKDITFDSKGNSSERSNSSIDHPEDLKSQYRSDKTIATEIIGTPKNINEESQVTDRSLQSGGDIQTEIEIPSEKAEVGTNEQVTIESSEHCGDCNGNGAVSSGVCGTCEGEGIIANEKTLDVRIPAGIESGKTLRLKNAGEPGRNGGSRGDVFVHVTVSSGSWNLVNDNEVVTESVDGTLDTADVSSIAVATRNGRLTVRSEDRDTVSLTGTKRANSEEALNDIALEINRTDGHLTVETDTEGDDGRLVSQNGETRVDLDIIIPKSLSVDRVATRNGTLIVENVAGNPTFETRNGRVEARDIDGDVVAQTRNGRLEVRDIDGDIVAQTRNGTVEIDAVPLVGDIDATTRNGDTELTVPTDINATLDLQTQKGTIEMAGLGQSISASSSSVRTTVGDVDHSVTVETRSGAITVSGTTE